MIARCDKCSAFFESHDGGTIINGVTYCPLCEPCFSQLPGNQLSGGVPDYMDSVGLTSDQTAALDEAAFQDAALDAYESGLDSTGLQVISWGVLCTGCDCDLDTIVYSVGGWYKCLRHWKQ